jgi:predicted  nucleic acid-binding Zn-ribbon protein
MNKFLKELIELNRLERKLKELEPVEASIKAPLIKLENQKKSLEERLEKLEDEIKNLKLKKSKNELLIAELKEKLKDIEEKQNKVKTEKEFKALQIEEELAREQIDAANDEIARFEKIIEQKEEEKSELLKEIEKLDADITLTKMDVDKKLEVVEKQKEEIYKKRDELIKNMNPQIYRFYEKIKRWAGITAVTPIKKQACTGCNMKINDKIYSEVLKGEEIVTCPHCGRVLYIEDEDKIQE